MINVPWQPVKTTRRTKTYKRRRLSQDNDYIQGSRYQPLDEIIDDETNNEADDISIFNDGGNFETNNYITSKKSVGINAGTQIKRPPNVVKQKPENERYFKKTVPGICSYAEVSCQGRKTCIIGASLIKRIDRREFNQYFIKRIDRREFNQYFIKRIDRREFNQYLRTGTAIKRSYPGATASQLKYYIDEVLNEENIDQIIINIGTNNLSKKQQPEEETVKEIIEIVTKCRHNYGINKIFVSGLTYRPRYSKQVNKINTLLRQNAVSHDYKFIGNSNISEKHLWKDQLHLNDQGTINFLDSLNRLSG